jgi:hypothetical protein
MAFEPREEYTAQLDDVIKNRDAVAGERRVKSKTTKYLPPTPSMCVYDIELENGNAQIVGANVSKQGQSSYQKYLSLAYFYGAAGRTVDGLTGLIFAKKAESELSNSVDYLKDNVDGKGNSIEKQSRKACEDGFITPRSALLVDFPDVGQHVSVAEAEANNLRPKILYYPFESILSWHYEVVNNELKLSFALLKEEVETRDGFTIERDHQYRVLELVDGVYRVGLYDSAGDPISEPVPVMVDGMTSSEIPLYFIEVGAEGKALLSDLVDANFNHYRFFADYAMKEHTSAFPVFYETGAVDDDRNIAVGPGAKWSNPNNGSSFGVLQSSSDGGSMRTYLQDMEIRMAALGAEMLKPRVAGAETAESKALDKVAQDSTTASVANAVSDAYEKAVDFAAKWLGDMTENVYRLNTDYNPGGLSGQELTALFATWQGGGISYETFYENLQRGQVANPERTSEEEQGLITNAGLGLE